MGTSKDDQMKYKTRTQTYTILLKKKEETPFLLRFRTKEKLNSATNCSHLIVPELNSTILL